MRPRRRSLVGLLSAQAISVTGTRMTAVALPWFVLTSTGSPTRTGLIVFAEMAPYVVAKAFSGPVIDRAGPRRVSIVTDLTSAALVAAVPVLYAADALGFGLLVALVAGTGAVRGPGNTAKDALVPEVVDEARVPLERATGLLGTADRLAATLGPAVGGALIAAFDAPTVLLLDAVSFVACGALLAATVPAPRYGDGEDQSSYLSRLRVGLDFLRTDRLLLVIIGMVAVTNLLDQALNAVLLPLWAHHDGGATSVGAALSALGAGAILGSTVAATIAHRLPRRLTYFVAFPLAGLPRFVILAVDAPLWLVVAVWAVSGVGSGFLNPILGAVVYERVPRPLLGRVGALGDSLAWAGIPLGGLVAAAVVAAAGLVPALVACGVAYLLATTVPGLRPEWREMDLAREPGNPRDQFLPGEGQTSSSGFGQRRSM